MTDEVGKEIGNKLGYFLEVDKWSWQEDQAKFMRVMVDIPVEQPLRRGGMLRIQKGKGCGSCSSMNSYPFSALTVV